MIAVIDNFLHLGAVGEFGDHVSFIRWSHDHLGTFLICLFISMKGDELLLDFPLKLEVYLLSLAFKDRKMRAWL